MAQLPEDIIRPSIKRIVPYSPGKPTREVQEELGPIEVVKLASNENPLGPSPLAIEAMERAIREVHIYPDPVCAELTAALAEKLGVGEEQIIIGRGSDELIHMIGLAFVNPGDQVVYSLPPFALYPFTTDLMAGERVGIPAREFKHDLEAMADAITDRTKVIFVANPYNPTGTISTAEEVERFMQRVPERCVVVFDEAYYEYVDDPAYPDTLEYVRQRRRAVVLRTFSKAYALAGLRIGYGIMTPEIAAALRQVREPFNVSSVAQAAALASLQDPEQVERSRRLVAEGKEYLYGEFQRLGLFYVPTQANFIFVDTGVDSRQLFDALMRRGVTIRTGDIFGYPTFIRVTIGTMDQNRKFVAALEEALAELKG